MMNTAKRRSIRYLLTAAAILLSGLRPALAEPGEAAYRRLNAALVSAGIAVSALAPLRADLESLFLDLTSAPGKEAAA